MVHYVYSDYAIKGIDKMKTIITTKEIAQLRALGQNRLERLYMKVYHKYADCYGMDVVTMEIVKPSALRALRCIWFAMYNEFAF